VQITLPEERSTAGEFIGSDHIQLETEDLINEQFLNDDQADEGHDEVPLHASTLISRTVKAGLSDGEDGLVDLEEIGNVIHRQKNQEAGESKESTMVTALQRKALTKEGYKIIGTHSAVKLCRFDR
jgi:tRNA wybutosine-synthesizing protein 1